MINFVKKLFMRKISTLIIGLVMGFSAQQLRSQTTYTVNIPSSGTNTVDVTCTAGDILVFKSASTPLAIKIFRNGTSSYSFTPSSNTSTYTVTSADTSYSSIVSLSPVSTCVGKINQGSTTGINTTATAHIELKLYPNPALNTLFIKGISSTIEFDVYDLSGQRVLKGKTSGQIDISELQTGLYILRSGLQHLKFMKG